MNSKTVLYVALGLGALWFLSRANIASGLAPTPGVPGYPYGYPATYPYGTPQNSDAAMVSAVGGGIAGIISSLGDVFGN